MGTTLTAVAMTSDTASIILHAGDSRLYRFRAGRLDQLTQDHTVVADLIRADELSEEEAQIHPNHQVLTRALGVGPDLEMDLAAVPCRTGDRLQLSTDGPFKTLSPDELNVVLTSNAGQQESVDTLIATQSTVPRRTTLPS